MHWNTARLAAATLVALIILATPIPVAAQVSAESRARAEVATFSPNIRPSLEIRRAAGPIVLDGELDDEGWRGAARLTNFAEIQPGNGVRPPVETEAWVTYDATHLYVAVRAQADPSRIRATLTDRDRAFQDDWVVVMLDTYGDASWAYFLGANPLGVQVDELYTNTSEDDSFDVVYESEGRITDDGYQLEFAIPFSSLRFPDRPVQTWRLNVLRNHPRDSRYLIAWAGVDLGDPCTLCQSGSITGIEGVRAGGRLEILPALVASQAGALRDLADPASGFDNDGINADLSLTLRYPFSSGLTAELAINPDFSQVEADAAQIDVNSTFALSYTERRPFFQEGSDLFRTWNDAVYTRSINAPIVASKLTGRIGRTSIAWIGARDERSAVILPFEEQSALADVGRSTSNIVRARRNFGNDSYIGALATDRRLDAGGAGSLVSTDGMLRFGGPWQLRWQIMASRTAEPDSAALTPDLDGLTFADGAHTAVFDGEAFWGHAIFAGLYRESRHLNVSARYNEASPTFRADNGFQTSNSYRRVESGATAYLYEVHRLVDRIGFGADVRQGWNFDGVSKERRVTPRISMRLKGQTEIWANVHFIDEHFRNVDFTGMRRADIEFNSNFSRAVSVGAWYQYGGAIARTLATPEPATATTFSAWMTLKPTTRLDVRPSYAYERLVLEDGTELYAGYILRANTRYQLTRELFLRVITQYDDFSGDLDVDPLLMYRINPFSIVYLGSTHDWRELGESRELKQARRQFFFKVQYLVGR